LPPGAPEQGAGAEEATVALVGRAKSGDAQAVEKLLARCLPPLRRWARGRLPRYARSLLDTEDLVQESLLNALRHLEGFEPRHEGSLQAYLRQAVVNRIRDEMRRAGRRPSAELPDTLPDEAASPLERAIGREALERYEAALAKLRPHDRELVVAGIELQYSHEELAAAFEKPTPNAARVALKRALERLLEQMGP
jgi:RNA polymerase sigma-70 factor (ECF subfamily)